jgi:hypothetical protein
MSEDPFIADRMDTDPSSSDALALVESMVGKVGEITTWLDGEKFSEVSAEVQDLTLKQMTALVQAMWYTTVSSDDERYYPFVEAVKTLAQEYNLGAADFTKDEDSMAMHIDPVPACRGGAAPRDACPLPRPPTGGQGGSFRGRGGPPPPVNRATHPKDKGMFASVAKSGPIPSSSVDGIVRLAKAFPELPTARLADMQCQAGLSKPKEAKAPSTVHGPSRRQVSLLFPRFLWDLTLPICWIRFAPLWAATILSWWSTRSLSPPEVSWWRQVMMSATSWKQ